MAKETTGFLLAVSISAALVGGAYHVAVIRPAETAQAAARFAPRANITFALGLADGPPRHPIMIDQQQRSSAAVGPGRMEKQA
jgi:hypothetical protein